MKTFFLTLCILSAPSSIFSAATHNEAAPAHLALFESIEKNDTQTFSTLIEKDPRIIHDRNSAGKTALHYAVEHGRPEMVASLLKYKALPNTHANDKTTPLSCAYGLPNPTKLIIANLLLEAGAEPINTSSSTKKKKKSRNRFAPKNKESSFKTAARL